MSRAEGTFEVELQPLPMEDGSIGITRMSIDKRFEGALQGTSRGVMMSAMGTAPGSAGYVAMERVTGELGGRSGEFVLQHFGAMRRGEGALTVEVVPDSGTGGLEGLVGSMTIDASAGHRYVFEYELPS